MLLNNNDYKFLVVSAALTLGSFTGGLLVSISFFVAPFGYKDSDISLIISIIPITGGIGVYIGQIILKKTRAYKKFIMAIIFMIPFILFLIVFMMETGSVWLTMLGFAVLGGVSLPIIPAFYEFSSELAFPVGEGSALGYLVGISSIIAFICGILFSQFIIGSV